MKSVLLLAVSMLLSAPALAQNCVDLSGQYVSDQILLDGRQLVMVIQQDACRSIALGSYKIRGQATIEESVEPKILFVTPAETALCQAPKCDLFVPTQKGVLLARAGEVAVTRTRKCKYHSVEWQRNENGDLVQVYNIKDSRFSCWGVRRTERVMKQRK